MITFGKSAYTKELQALWQEAFGDSDEYLNAFFTSVYKDENTLVYVEGGRSAAALYIVPYTMPQKEGNIKIAYLYALATRPSFRGQGIMARLIERSFEICQKRGYRLLTLIPSERSLFDYYRRFGFEESFDRAVITKDIGAVRAAAVGAATLPLKKADADTVYDAYMKSGFYGSNCVVLTKEQNRFYIETLEREGGQALTFTVRGENDGYMLLALNGEELTVYETNADSAVLPALYASLLKEYAFSSLTFIQPFMFSDKELSAARKPYAMSRSFDGFYPEKPFINRVLT